MKPQTQMSTAAATTSDSVQDLRRLSTEELTKLGEESLKNRLLEQAVFAHQKHGPITIAAIERMLNDPDCTRYPTRLVFEFGEMAMHQFAQPDIDWRNSEVDGRVLYLRPMLQEHPDLVVLAVAYMLPVLNYGENLITDEHCVQFGATLLGMLESEFYQQICSLADIVGADPRYPGQAESGCSSGCESQFHSVGLAAFS